MDDKMTNRIQDSVDVQRQSDYLMTQALIALEAGEWNKAAALCSIALKRCDNIEQRLAFQLLQGLAAGRDAAVVKQYLDEAYDI